MSALVVLHCSSLHVWSDARAAECHRGCYVSKTWLIKCKHCSISSSSYFLFSYPLVGTVYDRNVMSQAMSKTGVTTPLTLHAANVHYLKKVSRISHTNHSDISDNYWWKTAWTTLATELVSDITELQVHNTFLLGVPIINIAKPMTSFITTLHFMWVRVAETQISRRSSSAVC